MPSHSQKSSSLTPAELERIKKLGRDAVAEARARMRDLDAASPPAHIVGREAAEVRIRSAYRLNLVGSGLSKDRKRAAISFSAPGGDWAGRAASGVVLMRQEFNFHKNAKSVTCPAVVMTSHVMHRLVERTGSETLDEFMEKAKPVLGWAEVARHARVDGDFIVPTEEGLWFCIGSRRGLVGPDGKSHDVVALKTFIDHSRIMLALERIYSRLEKYVGIDLRFPMLDAPGAKELFAMAEMAAVGAERQAMNDADDAPRNRNRNRSSHGMGF